MQKYQNCYALNTGVFNLNHDAVEPTEKLCNYSGKTFPYIGEEWEYVKNTCKYLIKRRERNDEMLKSGTDSRREA